MRQVAKNHRIPKTTITKRKLGQAAEGGQLGRSTALLKYKENILAENIAALGNFGLAFDNDEMSLSKHTSTNATGTVP